MIVLTSKPGEAEKLQAGAPGLQRKYGMPIDPAPYLAGVLERARLPGGRGGALNAPSFEERLLRRLRVRRMDGGLLDDPGLIAAAATDVGLDPERCSCAGATRPASRTRSRRTSRAPATRRRPPARSTTKLGGPATQRRYTAPSYELSFGGRTFSLPGFNPIEAYEAAIAEPRPDASRRAQPERVEDVLRAFDEPLATAEVEAILGRSARTQLGRAATPIPAGADRYWRL